MPKSAKPARCARQSVLKKPPAGKLGPAFGGAAEADIRQLTLPDLITTGLDILFVGINPGLYSAYHGHYYSKKGNHFWPCLTRSGLVPAHFTPDHDSHCLQHNIGFTDIVKRCTRAQSELQASEFESGCAQLEGKIREFSPLLVVFNGKQIYSRFVRRKLKDVVCGSQGRVLGGCGSSFYVMTNSSPLNAHFPTADSRMFYYEEIKALVSSLKKSPYFSSTGSNSNDNKLLTSNDNDQQEEKQANTEV